MLAAIYLDRVESVDLDNGSFTAAFTIGLECSWECRFDEFTIVNGRSSSVRALPTRGEAKLWDVEAQLFFTPDLHQFPFDEQQLPIQIEHASADASTVHFRPVKSLSGIPHNLNVPDWTVEGWDITFRDDQYLDRATYSQLDFTLAVGRNLSASIFTIFLPILTITFVALAWLVTRDPREQLRGGGTALIAALLFWVGIGAGLSEASYMTLLDKIMTVIYATLALVVVTAVAAEVVRLKYEPEGVTTSPAPLRATIHKWSLIGVPLFCVVGIATVIITR